ncbi:MAG: hypothetical protein O2780_10520 [Proteobacteria bacterium]|jgi:hypothetical protein|nr:hypothetical protein [Pseudomonadota bacterium]MDA1301540.1 hypothetical protein [Pseudomonadota bacterium]
MDDKDKPEDESPESLNSDEDGIPLLHDVVFDPAMPLRAPRRVAKDHGPDYDPDTIDLFGDPPIPSETALRQGAEKVVDDLVAEYSKEITDRLRNELTDQLNSILNDLRPDLDSGRGKGNADKS